MSTSPQPSGTGRPSSAGIYDYILGGQSHTAADRDAAEKALALAPDFRFAAIENRAFLQRAVRYLAGRGVRQYIDIGSGYPTAGPVHEVAAEIVADPHVVYVDYDPAVADRSRALVTSPYVAVVRHDLRRPLDIIDDPDVARLIDWSQPVAVLMVAVLHFVPEAANPAQIIATFRRRLSPGSYLVLSHGSPRQERGTAQEAARAWAGATPGLTGRTREAIHALFAGFDLVPPGLVTTTEWGTTQPAPDGQGLVLAGVGRIT
jgi:hypothetical protein